MSVRLNKRSRAAFSHEFIKPSFDLDLPRTAHQTQFELHNCNAQIRFEWQSRSFSTYLRYH